MTYLELVQALWRETGTGGPEPQSILNQVGEAKRLVEWVKKADIHIQTLYRDWNFLWAQGSFDTVDGQRIYGLAPDMSHVDRDAWYITSDQYPTGLAFDEYLDIKDESLDTVTTAKPYQVTMLPDRTVRLTPIPDATIHTIGYDYWTAPVELTENDAAVSVIPEEFHRAILGKAIMYYAEYEAAPEQMEHGGRMFAHHMENLIARELPGMRYSHKVAEGNDLVITVE